MRKLRSASKYYLKEGRRGRGLSQEVDDELLNNAADDISSSFQDIADEYRDFRENYSDIEDLIDSEDYESISEEIAENLAYALSAMANAAEQLERGVREYHELRGGR